jgi:hypothetical protein
MPRAAIPSPGHRHTTGIPPARRPASIAFPEPKNPHSKIRAASGPAATRHLHRTTAARPPRHAHTTAPPNGHGLRRADPPDTQ